MVFCAYCGKSFTRKEHLERHIPSHTNVKPHRCSFCQLSFARRDLLQRHHSTYHEIRDPSASPTGIPIYTGKTPIACIHCASAKTGCDKKVPCSRCADKNLPCAARFARRSSKAAIRAMTAAEIQQRALRKTSEKLPSSGSDASSGGHDTPMVAAIETLPSPDDLVHVSSNGGLFYSDPLDIHLGAFDGMDLIQYNTDFTSSDFAHHDLLSWNEFPIDIDPYISQVDIGQIPFGLAEAADRRDSISGSEVAGESLFSTPTNSHTRGTSIGSVIQQEIHVAQTTATTPSTDFWGLDFEAVLESESSWPFVRCNPVIFSGTCPRTAILHLESLKQITKGENAWKSLEGSISQVEIGEQCISVQPLSSSTRDKILAITQSFVQRAMEKHSSGSAASFGIQGQQNCRGLNFLVLPPTNVLEFFLSNYAHSMASYYSLVSSGVVDPNEMILNNQASTLLFLLMIAQGATATPTAESKCLTAGLIETCRISLFDIIERDIELCADPIVLRCALLFTILGAWSGDKWHSDIIMGQRCMYMAMLKHSGMLESQPSTFLPSAGLIDFELQWQAWIQTESKNRLVYDWVFVDLELSVFHDTAPLLSIAEIETPLPDSELLWLAKDSSEWLEGVEEAYYRPAGSSVKPPIPMPLADLFQDLLHDTVDCSHITPLKLRLLLHPIQSLLCSLRQVFSCFSDVLGSRRSQSRALSKASTADRLEEVQTLLQKWYDLCQSTPDGIVTRTNLLLYHLISLNAISSFIEIERLARKERFDGSYWELSLRHKKCIHSSNGTQEANFHAGQILRIARDMAGQGRPQWLPVAVYRATMILWVNCLATRDPDFPPEPACGQIVAIDDAVPEDPALICWVWRGEGVPVLTGVDGGLTKLEDPGMVLGCCIGFLGEDSAGRLTEGIRRKLRMLHASWHGSGVDFR